MKKNPTYSLLLIMVLFPSSLFSQEQVFFPDDFNSSLVGKEVILSIPMTVVQTYYKTPSGTLILAPGLLYGPTEVRLPGVEANAMQEWNNELKLNLISNESYINSDYTLRVGTHMNNLRGKVGYSNGRYSLTPTARPVIEYDKRTATNPDIGNHNLKVVSFNLEYYISDPTAWGQGFGPANQAQFIRQRAKILAALKAMNADIYALCEVQEGPISMEDLTKGMNEVTGTNNYSFVKDFDKTGSGSTYTKNIFIYNNKKVTPYGALMLNGYYLPKRHIAQAFDLLSNGERVIVSCNHFKSKSGNGSGANADQEDGQGSFSNKRREEARSTLTFLNTLITNFKDPDVLVVGDLNCYMMEDPIRILEEGGLVSQLERFSPLEYSYLFKAEVGYLDHSLTTQSLNKQVSGAVSWNINACEPAYLGYDFTQYYTPDPYRSSDHNPIVTGVMLGADPSGTINPSSTESKGLTIYGDPSAGFITLEADRIDRVEVISVHGQVVFSEKSSSVGPYFVLDLTTLPKGFHLIRTYDGKKLLCAKIAIP